MPPDSPTTDRPPRRRKPPETPQEASSAPPKAAPPAPPGKSLPQLQKKLETMLVAVSLPFAAAGDTHCAMIFATRGPYVAEAWANLAAESPAVKRVLEAMLKGGAWSGALASTAALVIPVAAHHGLPIPDVVTPMFFGKQEEPKGGDPTNDQPPPFVAPDNGVPGPAAYSAPGTNGTGASDPTDPFNYPGNIPPESV